MNNNQKPFYLGAAYYPELWDISCVDKDIKIMKEIGCNTVRIGEFAWGTMEHGEGNFDLSFFRTVVDKLSDAGIYIIMCTPSATPPQWLTDKYEETMRMTPAQTVRLCADLTEKSLRRWQRSLEKTNLS